MQALLNAIDDGTEHPSLDAFGKLICENGDDMRVLDTTGALRMSDAGNGLRPEIYRGTLRKLILSSLPPEIVHWNAKVVGVDKVGGRYELVFAAWTSGVDAQLAVRLAVSDQASFVRKREHQSLANQSRRCRVLLIGIEIVQFDEANARIGRFDIRDERPDLRPSAICADQDIGGDDAAIIAMPLLASGRSSNAAN